MLYISISSFSYINKKSPKLSGLFLRRVGSGRFRRKSSADEGKRYINIVSVETAIENKNQWGRKKAYAFNIKNKSIKNKRRQAFAHLLFVFGYAKYDAPTD